VTRKTYRRWMNPDYLSTGQVAKILHVSIQTVIRMCDCGHLPCVRPSSSSHRAVPREGLRAYLESHPDIKEFALPF
jgi:excisionase family DNA binding protein